MVIVSIVALAVAVGATLALWLTRHTKEEPMSDYAVVRVHVEETREVIRHASTNAAGLEVRDEPSFTLAQEVIKEIKRRASALEARREEYMKPLRQLMKLVRDDTVPVLLAAEEVERILKGKCLRYRQEVTRLRAEAEAQARAAIAAHAPPQEQRAALVAVAEASAPKTDGVSYRDNWQARVTDQSAVPEHFWIRVISQAMIDADMQRQIDYAKAHGQKPAPTIAGVTITNDVIMSVRK